MADYYPLIARAIAGLDPNAPGESRRALYERARAALIAQLRSVQPPLSESEITRERLSLEEAVRKVESEAAQRAREAARGASARPGDALRRNNVGRPPGDVPQPGALAPNEPAGAAPPRSAAAWVGPQCARPAAAATWRPRRVTPDPRPVSAAILTVPGGDAGRAGAAPRACRRTAAPRG
jgi:hypothetical protein